MTAQTDDDDGMLTAIEVRFAIPVRVTQEQERRFAKLVEEIAEANTPAGHVHWLSSYGSKPTFSQADARFLGTPIDPDAPLSGEPTFNDMTLSFSTHCREAYESDRT